MHTRTQRIEIVGKYLAGKVPIKNILRDHQVSAAGIRLWLTKVGIKSRRARRSGVK